MYVYVDNDQNANDMEKINTLPSADQTSVGISVNRRVLPRCCHCAY